MVGQANDSSQLGDYATVDMCSSLRAVSMVTMVIGCYGNHETHMNGCIFISSCSVFKEFGWTLFLIVTRVLLTAIYQI